MTSRDFCYWLQGYFEILGAVNPEDEDEIDRSLSEEQVEMIQKHLHLVFKHEIDPSYGDEKHQKDLDKIHNPIRPSSGMDKLIRC